MQIKKHKGLFRLQLYPILGEGMYDRSWLHTFWYGFVNFWSVLS